MKYKFLRISLLSALAVLFGGTALGAFMAAAEADGDSESGGSETVILSWNEVPTTSNLTTDEMTGEEGKDPAKNVATWSNDYSIMIMRWDKGQSNGENLTIDGTSYKTIKVSNGAQNKLILPEGKVTKKITLYSYVNVNTAEEAAVAYWKEVAGKAYTVEETGMSAYIVDKKHQGIDKFEFTFDATNEVTFTNAGKQCCYVIAVEVEDAAVEEPEPETPSIFPITEDFKGETSIFEGGEIINDEKAGNALKVSSTTATASFSPAYTLAENEKVTFQFTAFQGWVSGGLSTVTIKNSEGQDLVSYLFDNEACNITDVAIGGTTVEGFEAFFAQSNSTNASSKGSANTFGHGSQPFVATEGYNPLVTISVSGSGLVEFNLQYTGAPSKDVNVSYSGTLPEGTKVDLGSFVLESNKADAFGITNLSITTATEENVEDPALAEMKEQLSQMVAQYEGADLSGYTEESAAAFTKAIEDVKAEIANPNATEESLMAVYYALAEALQGLEEKPGVDEGTWKTVGTAILEDPWVLPGLGIDQHEDENKWEVPLERNTANENLYRLVDPYHAGPAAESNESKKIGYITFDVTDPDHVVFSITNAGFANSTTVKPKVNVFYAYNQISKFIAYGYTIADVVETYGDDFPYTTFKDGVVTLGEGDACYGEQSDMVGGYDWGDADMTGTITLKINEAGNETAARRWDFTNWSDATVANLQVDAAASKVEGWSDVEKEADAAADADPTETSKDNCFWAASSMKADEIYGLSANGIVIDELKGLKFTGALNSRNLAIAVNYPVAISTYEGASYLWLGGKNKQFFTIPAVAGGTTIKMGVESHNTGSTRGVDLLVNGTSIGKFTPTVYEEHIWTVPAGEAVDVVVDNTDGCHIYFIEVEQDQEALLAVATADLKTVIAAAEAIEDLTIYTEESVTAFNAALAAAKAAEGTTIKAQTEAAYALINAKAALQKAEPDPDPVTMTYTVKEVAGDIVFRTTEGEALEGTDVKVAYRLYNADENGKLYKKGATSKEYNYSFKLTEEGQEEAIEYDATDVENVIFIAEGEDIEALTPITTGNAAIRSSNSAAGHAAEDTEIVVLTAGTYTIHVVMYDAAKGGGEEFTFKAGEQENTLTAGENISESEFELTLTESTSLILVANTATNKGLDAIYITSTDGEVITGISTINAEAGNGAIYNLQGQKVEKAQKGLYIINGKKVVIK